jgi:hypothetical protein
LPRQIAQLVKNTRFFPALSMTFPETVSGSKLHGRSIGETKMQPQALACATIGTFKDWGRSEKLKYV